MILWQKLCIIVYVSLPCCTLCCATHCKFKHFVSYFLKPTVLDLCSSRHLWEWKKNCHSSLYIPCTKKKNQIQISIAFWIESRFRLDLDVMLIYTYIICIYIRLHRAHAMVFLWFCIMIVMICFGAIKNMNL